SQLMGGTPHADRRGAAGSDHRCHRNGALPELPADQSDFNPYRESRQSAGPGSYLPVRVPRRSRAYAPSLGYGGVGMRAPLVRVGIGLVAVAALLAAMAIFDATPSPAVDALSPLVFTFTGSPQTIEAVGTARCFDVSALGGFGGDNGDGIIGGDSGDIGGKI